MKLMLANPCLQSQPVELIRRWPRMTYCISQLACAGMRSPNLGLNAVAGMIRLT